MIQFRLKKHAFQLRLANNVASTSDDGEEGVACLLGPPPIEVSWVAKNRKRPRHVTVKCVSQCPQLQNW